MTMLAALDDSRFTPVSVIFEGMLPFGISLNK
jgi:hypothetical protein